MASIYDLKPLFQNMLRPCVKRLAAKAVSANQVTIFAAAGSLVLGILTSLFPNDFFLALLPLWLFIRMALNAIDGMLAREFNQKSPLGGLLNELSDLVSDGALYLPFVFVAPCSAAIVTILVILALIVEVAGIIKLEPRSSRRYQGPFGKSDRAFAFGALSLLLVFGYRDALWINLLLASFCALALWTIYNRCKAALNELEVK